jgi:OmpA-OmpF porin, OOP family
MHAMPKTSGLFVLATMLAVPASIAVAQPQEDTANPNIIVNGELIPDTTAMTKGPEVKGIITARKGDKMKVTAADGTSTLIFINDATKIKSGSLFGGDSKLGASALLNGLPVTVKTMQAGNALLASQIVYRGGDFKTASMIRNGTAQGFAEQTAATQALRGRVADIDQYNVKNTTNVNFDVGKAVLSSQAQVDLCTAAKEAEGTNNALLLVVGYTDATGSQEFNQQLSEKRASRVVNYLQQSCGWKPYRMLTPTGMSEADPLADNETPQGKAQNRRVAVNILVSKAADGL